MLFRKSITRQLHWSEPRQTFRVFALGERVGLSWTQNLSLCVCSARVLVIVATRVACYSESRYRTSFHCKPNFGRLGRRKILQRLESSIQRVRFGWPISSGREHDHQNDTEGPGALEAARRLPRPDNMQRGAPQRLLLARPFHEARQIYRDG